MFLFCLLTGLLTERRERGVWLSFRSRAEDLVVVLHIYIFAIGKFHSYFKGWSLSYLSVIDVRLTENMFSWLKQPSIHYLFHFFFQGHMRNGTNPGGHWARGRAHPGQAREAVKQFCPLGNLISLHRITACDQFSQTLITQKLYL